MFPRIRFGRHYIEQKLVRDEEINVGLAQGSSVVRGQHRMLDWTDTPNHSIDIGATKLMSSFYRPLGS